MLKVQSELPPIEIEDIRVTAIKKFVDFLKQDTTLFPDLEHVWALEDSFKTYLTNLKKDFS